MTIREDKGVSYEGLPDDLDISRIQAQPLTPEIIDKARRTVAGRSHDADECRGLFAMLGIEVE